MKNYIRYGRSAGSGFWDIDSGVVHFVDNGKTLCNVKVPSRAQSKGRWEETWYEVNCRRCLKVKQSLERLAKI